MNTTSPLSKISLFWDVDRATLDVEQHQKFIIERILSRGDVADFMWAREQYGVAALKDSFLQARTLNPKAVSFWSNYFHIDPSLCTQKPSLLKRDAFWQRSASKLP
ncbi:MAG: hypothetical protein WCG84_02375 [Candidatus Moraniibacteriota bacterium]